MLLKSYGITDIGKKREENQDAFYSDDKEGVYIVADGMGGMQDGAEAASYVVKALTILLGEQQKTVEEADAAVKFHKEALGKVSMYLRKSLGRNTGSTVVTVTVYGDEAVISNVGDSPAFLWREGKLKKLTKEHNLAAAMVEAGLIIEEHARLHPGRNKLTAYMGMDGQPPVNVDRFRLFHKDRMLLCSDGLTGMVELKEIAKVLSTENDARRTCESLVDMAKEVGGLDNITVIVIDVEDLK